MLKLYLGTKTPAFAKVVTQINHCMGNVETSVTGIILMFLGLTVATHVVAVIISCKVCFAIATNAQT
jgi:hypothetical protein